MEFPLRALSRQTCLCWAGGSCRRGHPRPASSARLRHRLEFPKMGSTTLLVGGECIFKIGLSKSPHRRPQYPEACRSADLLSGKRFTLGSHPLPLSFPPFIGPQNACTRMRAHTHTLTPCALASLNFSPPPDTPALSHSLFAPAVLSACRVLPPSPLGKMCFSFQPNADAGPRGCPAPCPRHPGHASPSW